MLRIGDFVRILGGNCGKVVALKQNYSSARRPIGGAIRVVMYETDDQLNPTEPVTGKEMLVDSYDVPELWAEYRVRSLQSRQINDWRDRESNRRQQLASYGNELLKTLGLSEIYRMSNDGNLYKNGPLDLDKQLPEIVLKLTELAGQLGKSLPKGFDKLKFDPEPEPQTVEVVL